MYNQVKHQRIVNFFFDQTYHNVKFLKLIFFICVDWFRQIFILWFFFALDNFKSVEIWNKNFDSFFSNDYIQSLMNFLFSN